MINESSRYQRGLIKLAEIDGHVGEEVVAPLGDLGRYIVEFAFGDIYNRDGISLCVRERILLHKYYLQNY